MSNNKAIYTFFYLSIMSILCLGVAAFSSDNTKEVILEKPITEELNTISYDSVLSQVKFYEGFKASRYTCPGGKSTIGYGFTKYVYTKSIITKAEAHSILKDHFNKCLLVAEADGLSGNKALAIADFIYNLGVPKYKKSTLRQLILEGKSIDKKILEYRKGGGKVLKGLEKRRKWELEIYNTK